MAHLRASLRRPLECGCPSPAVGLLEERRRVLQLLRALEAVGLGPQGRPRLAFALVKLLELDLLLAGILTRLQRGGDPDPYVTIVGQLVPIGADKRRKVLNALDGDEPERVAAALARTSVSEEDALREPLGMPCEPAPPMLGGIPLPLRDSDVEFLATTALGTVLPWPRGP